MMPQPRRAANPKNLNSLQLRTLAVLQLLARDPAWSGPPDAAGDVAIRGLPQPHGDHFHIAGGVVSARDASGLRNPNVLAALARKGLLRATAEGLVTLTAEGLAYDTGLGRLLQPSE
ncbi:hypothetical protein HRbin40_01572 [bacterium HR40]|nr:hypothetical protein HRbin40_01572 [bacterium HR40]